MQVVGKSDPVIRAKRDVGMKDGRLMGSLETDSEVQNEKGFSESETIVGLNIGMNADDSFIVAERASRAVRMSPHGVSGLVQGYVDVFEKGFSDNEEAMVLNPGTNMVDSGFIEDRVSDAFGLLLDVEHVDEVGKGLSGNCEVLKGGVNAGKLSLVEDSGSGGLGLSSGVVADLMDDGFILRMTRSKSCAREKLLDRGGQDFGRSGIVKVFGLNPSSDQEVLV
ncbi:hypothetical protein AVEN_12687-1 [Araneus ventricosus]|uniref:Uncharacterized protein n=1 Tax=Araneus ventricosus TaxID=182803 RepID=A0A4Y2ACN5_ARAVE|nr:hypothetical protein AVEN_12687-1 [Araneus ventricosus]